MANSIEMPKSYLVMGLCLPLAVLLGYLLAEPMELGSLAVLALVIGVLATPLLLKWHYVLLLFSWNAAVNPVILPGRPHLWMVMAFVSLLCALLSRAVNPSARFVVAPSVTKALVLLIAVAMVTMMFTGGFGVRAFGAERYGGKRYVFLLAAIAGYFALTSRRIPPHRAGIYVAIFFLSGLTNMVGNLVVLGGPKFYYLLDVFSPELAIEQAVSENSVTENIVRFTGVSVAAMAVFFVMLARYGLRGILDLSRPWRLLFFSLICLSTLWGGFRSFPVLFGLTFLALFWVEGLHRTKYLTLVAGAGLLATVFLVLYSERLPLVAQRTLSFLPIKIDAMARHSAESSTLWRLDMWKQVIPDIPKHLLLGKGYSLDPSQIYLASETSYRQLGDPAGYAILAGDYHSGPLSVILTFGIFGVIGFAWFLVASIKVLHRNYQYGDPALRNINAFLLAGFIARTLFFFFVFGSLHSDLSVFVGFVGLGVALNGSTATDTQAEQSPEGVSLHESFPSSYSQVGLADHV